MHIDPTSTIASQPALKVREFMRSVQPFNWSLITLADKLHVDLADGEAILQQLIKLEYVELMKDRSSGESYYTSTLKGNAFAMTSAAPPITRKSADRILTSFLNRVESVNADAHYLYTVDKVWVFGSYLSQASRLNDIDVAVELTHRTPDSHLRRAADTKRIDEALAAGRRFSNIVAQISWPYYEVVVFLKGRSRAISLHTSDDGILKKVEVRLLYEAKSR